jgi:GT2 family glycosyltransferase
VQATIIVPLTGRAAQATRMLQALAAAGDAPGAPDHEVVIVDDASTGLDDLLGRIAGDVEIVRLAERSGLAAAATAGLARARGDVVVLLCEGAEVRPGFLAPLVAALGGDPGLAAAAPSGSVPVAAPALAWRRCDLAPEAVPAAPDAHAVAALCADLARRGRVEAVAGSAVVGPRRGPAAGPPAGPRPPAARAHLGADPELTVVIPTLDAASPRLRACVAALQAGTDVPYELVVVDNGAPPQGFSAPVNAGLRAARGAYAVVCNDDVLVEPGWWEPLRDALDAGAAVAFPRTVGGVSREDFAAWCFALSREALEAFAVRPGEFLHPGLRVWYQDTDLLVRLRAAGRPPVLVEASTIRHGLSETLRSPDAAFKAWLKATIEVDRKRFEALHGAAVEGAAS